MVEGDRRQSALKLPSLLVVVNGMRLSSKWKRGERRRIGRTCSESGE